VAHFEDFLLLIKVTPCSEAINLSVALKRPERSFGGTTDSSVSSFTDGSTRVYSKCAAAHLLYLDVTQQDLQREFHCARQKAASLHPIPKLPLPQATTPERVDLPAIRNAIAVVRRFLQLFRLELQDPNARRKLRRLSQRLLTLSHVLDHIAQE
jgi:hypothetical protein